jgi:hypothetical protein
MQNLKTTDHLGTPRHRWEGNAEMDANKIWCDNVECVVMVGTSGGFL